MDKDGHSFATRESYDTYLGSVNRKQPLQERCSILGLKYPKSANVARLKHILLEHWFPLSRGAEQTDVPEQLAEVDPNDDEEALVRQFDIPGAEAVEVMGFGDDDDSEDEYFDEDNEPVTVGDEDDDLTGLELSDPVKFEVYKTRIRIQETQRAEMNRREGGIKTQRAMEKAWKEFTTQALEKQQIKDDIIDEHHLLLFLKYCSERPKRTSRGLDIPGTFIGASHIKKLYFGALRIRKAQDARNPKLRAERPAVTVHVWDTLKGRMNEALLRVRNGLTPAEDAPDIIANTFLAGITETQMDSIGLGFLSHRELSPTVNGHLAWTAQNASGNRGDDFRALKVCEIQPHTFSHPIHEQNQIFSLLALQGEEKAGAHRGMRTKINPVYTAFIAHRQPERCPLGAFAFYFHFIHDHKCIADALEIDWTINKSWRQIRVLHGSKSPTTPYHEQSLYNLYVRAFAHANFASHIKQHLPRHVLGFRQEAMGVNPQETAKLGWERGKTYESKYKPPLPKEAILGSHGYRSSETYDPEWTHINVPDQFLRLFCPRAEEMFERLDGQLNIQGAANHFKMIIRLRPYLFQCAAAIYQLAPNSSLFKLPALANKDVRNWMSTTYLTELSLLKAQSGDSFEVERIQNKEISQSLAGMRSMIDIQNQRWNAHCAKIERRTAILSPSKILSRPAYYNPEPPASATPVAGPSRMVLPLHKSSNSQPLRFSTPERQHEHLSPTISDDAGFYIADDHSPRAFVNQSLAASPRLKTQVDLVLPPAAAFCKPGSPQLLWPPVLGYKSVTWDQVFALIEPESAAILWSCWKPSKTLNDYTLEELWTCYNTGEQVFDNSGVPNGIKPPLRIVEEYFRHTWRKSKDPNDRKKWERFREIPEWIKTESERRQVSPNVVIEELKNISNSNSKITGLNALGIEVKKMRFDRKKSQLEVAEGQNNTVEPQTEVKRKAAPVDRRKYKKTKL